MINYLHDYQGLLVQNYLQYWGSGVCLGILEGEVGFSLCLGVLSFVSVCLGVFLTLKL